MSRSSERVLGMRAARGAALLPKVSTRRARPQSTRPGLPAKSFGDEGDFVWVTGGTGSAGERPPVDVSSHVLVPEIEQGPLGDYG